MDRNFLQMWDYSGLQHLVRLKKKRIILRLQYFNRAAIIMFDNRLDLYSSFLSFLTFNFLKWFPKLASRSVSSDLLVSVSLRISREVGAVGRPSK